MLPQNNPIINPSGPDSVPFPVSQPVEKSWLDSIWKSELPPANLDEPPIVTMLSKVDTKVFSDLLESA
jgi:hypothetical protein